MTNNLDMLKFVVIGDRLYRFSTILSLCGYPVLAHYFSPKGEWRTVSCTNRLHQLGKLS